MLIIWWDAMKCVVLVSEYYRIENKRYMNIMQRK